MVRDSTEIRTCDECRADTWHSVTYARLSSTYAEEDLRCKNCTHHQFNTYSEGEDQ